MKDKNCFDCIHFLVCVYVDAANTLSMKRDFIRQIYKLVNCDRFEKEKDL